MFSIPFFPSTTNQNNHVQLLPPAESTPRYFIRMFSPLNFSYFHLSLPLTPIKAAWVHSSGRTERERAGSGPADCSDGVVCSALCLLWTQRLARTPIHVYIWTHTHLCAHNTYPAWCSSLFCILISTHLKKKDGCVVITLLTGFTNFTRTSNPTS